MVFRRTWKDPTKPKGFRVSKVWYGSFQDVTGKPKRVKLLTDKRESERLLEQRRLRVEQQRMGLIPSYDEAEKRPLAEHLDDYGCHLRQDGRTWKHTRGTVARVSKLLTACGFITIGDVKAEAVEAFLSDLLRSRCGTVTRNHYLRAVKSFVKWLVDTGRTGRNPLAGLKSLNAGADLRHERRALTDDEARLLIQVAAKGEAFVGVSGAERVLVYRLALTTGLRANEIRTLTWSSLDLDTAKPTVTVEAAYSKHRRRDVLPLSLETAGALHTWRNERRPTDSTEQVFRFPAKAAGMLRKDLKVAGIAYRDDAKRVLDFQSLRHTFITGLVEGGVNPKVAQALARHSSITLTLDRYTHLDVLNHRERSTFSPT